MRTEREELFFEPRCVDGSGAIRWYGEILTSEKLWKYCFRTVYIRDSGSSAYVYEMYHDVWDSETEEIRTTLKLICKIKKVRGLFSYGRKRGK